MGSWKKKAASSKYTADYSQCVRCHVAKHGSERKFHWCESCASAFDKVKDDKVKRIAFCYEGQRPTECVFSSDEEA